MQNYIELIHCQMLIDAKADLNHPGGPATNALQHTKTVRNAHNMSSRQTVPKRSNMIPTSNLSHSHYNRAKRSRNGLIWFRQAISVILMTTAPNGSETV